MRGRASVSAALLFFKMQERRDNQLSRREREVLQLAMEGRTDKEIAKELAISPSTVKIYWQRIRSKIGGQTRTQMVANSMRLGLQSGATVENLLGPVNEIEEVVERFEALFAELVNHAPMTSVVLDTDMRILSVRGVPNGSSPVTGRSATDHIRPDFIDKSKERFARVVRDGVVEDTETPAILADGREVLYRGRLVPIRARSGEVIAVLYFGWPSIG
jgi:DNA-binding CsgD family transcriptional regulator